MNTLHSPQIDQQIPSHTGDPTGNIWITSKCHKSAEARFRAYDSGSHALLTWYSICLIYFSITIENSELPATGFSASNVSILLSALIVIVSTLIWALRFGETAAEHRNCYQALDILLEEKSSDIQEKYRRQLMHCPNFSACAQTGDLGS